MRSYPFSLFLFATLGLIFSWVDSSQAHQVEGANLQLIAELSDEKFTYDVSAETSLVPALAEITFGTDPLPTKEAVEEALVEYISKHCPVLIDGIAVTPVLEDIEFQPSENQVNLGAVSNFVMAYFILNYPIKTKPETIDMTWGIFLPDKVKEIVPQTPDPTGHEPQTVDSIFYTYGELDLMTFTPGEPQYIWHTPEPILSVDAEQRLNAAALAAQNSHKRTFPLGWTLAGLFLSLTLFTGIKSNYPLAATFAVCGIASAIAHQQLSLSLDSKRESLSPTVAMQRFKDLHQNIYRAFDYDTDDAIYDTLAQSVTGDLLEEIYRDVYKSLILKEDGGAVCRVKKLDYLDCLPSELQADEEGHAFDCHWRVHGLVQHWGHTHERVNEYQARYALSPVEGQWRIAKVDVSQEKRMEAAPLESTVN